MAWEYLTINHEVDDSELNKNGVAGWELVAVVAQRDHSLKYFFKRESSGARKLHERLANRP